MEVYTLSATIKANEKFSNSIDNVIKHGVTKKYKKASINTNDWKSKSAFKYTKLNISSKLIFHAKNEGLDYYIFDNENKNKPVTKKLISILVVSEDEDIEDSLNFTLEDMLATFDITIDNLDKKYLYLYPINKYEKDIDDEQFYIKTKIVQNTKISYDKYQLGTGLIIFLLTILPFLYGIKIFGIEAQNFLFLSTGIFLTPLAKMIFTRKNIKYRIKIVSAEDIIPMNEKSRLEEKLDGETLNNPSLEGTT